MLFVVVGGTL